MSDNIVNLMRDPETRYVFGPQAADEIVRLRAELAAAQLSADLITQQGDDLCTKYINERDAVAARLENALNEGAQRRAERDALRAELAAAREALRLFLPYGCPVCHGDCSAANPPVTLCPMQAADAALRGE